ncbi:MAG: DUF4177 domain-containing protein [Oscillospiraceae bacterium]|jgi:hypothetical protein|nr:DUF4177 domain-containing protein [Oscillospiraceae bacterium]
MQNWEYRTESFKTDGFLGGNLHTDFFNEELNKLGKDGWELVSCFDTNESGGNTRLVIAVFKRPLK